MFKNKKGQSIRGLGSGVIVSAFAALIVMVVLFLGASELLPEAQQAGDTLNATGVPLGSLFVGGGVVFLIVMAALLFAVMGGFGLGGGRR